MSVSKVSFDGHDLINLENDTVTAAHLENGYTAHSANGDVITGTLPSVISVASESDLPSTSPDGTIALITGV